MLIMLECREQWMGDPLGELGTVAWGGGGMGHVQGQGSLVTASPGAGREASLSEDKVSKGRDWTQHIFSQLWGLWVFEIPN